MVEDYNSYNEETNQEVSETPQTDTVEYNDTTNETANDGAEQNESDQLVDNNDAIDDGSDALPDYDVSDAEKEAVDKIESPTEFVKGDYLYEPNEQNVDTEEGWNNCKEILNDCAQNGYMVGTQNDSHSYAYSFKNMDDDGNCPYVCHDKINDSYSDGICSTKDIANQIKENGSFTYYEKNRVNVNKRIR